MGPIRGLSEPPTPQGSKVPGRGRRFEPLAHGAGEAGFAVDPRGGAEQNQSYRRSPLWKMLNWTRFLWPRLVIMQR